MVRFFVSLAACFALAIPSMLGCTSAIISAKANPYGRPLLWKHRDTDKPDNKIEYVKATRPGEFAFVALFNAGDSRLEEAWMGMNDVGFAIMNTASYNLKADRVPKSKMDQEGRIMARALRTCRSVDDFARLLESLPKPLGVEANFGVIDAAGNGAYFETDNKTFRRFDLADAPDGVLIRTNYSKSGRDNEGFGFCREAAAEHLLAPYIAQKSVTPEVLTEVVSRSFYHGLTQRDYVDMGDEWAVDQDFIPRASSTASIVIEGAKPGLDPAKVKPGELADEYIMWTALGYPPVAELQPVWCKPDGVAPQLRGTLAGGHSEAGDAARKRQAEVFPITKGNGQKYVNLWKLYNAEGTGYCQVLAPRNREVYERTRRARDSR